MEKFFTKKNIIIVSAVLALAIIVSSLFIIFGGGDFRRAKWGMTPDKVRKVENATLINDSTNKISYKTDSVDGLKVDTIFFYNFDNETNRLRNVTMGFDVEGIEDKLARKIISHFEEKYGETDEYEETYASYEYIWYTDRTQIRIYQLETYILISYADINYPFVLE